DRPKQHKRQHLRRQAEKAVSVYRKLGFEVTREFNYFSQETARIDLPAKVSDFPYSVRRIDIAEHDTIPGFWDFRPSWQNSPESVERASGDLVSLGVFDGDTLEGYCVFEPGSGDVTQIGVDRRRRRQGIGSALLREMAGLSRSGILKVINTDTGCEAITRLLENRNIPVRGKQFEMIKTL
ncbi:GNAT family N-acetyltransferase, partial [uncultured Alistipes sp.]|uniref:GNAT family N-acetyltransferase n=1 Tax=uncultured Alistipes sp. TaxID=538949 RepID=UPI00258B2DAE